MVRSWAADTMREPREAHRAFGEDDASERVEVDAEQAALVPRALSTFVFRCTAPSYRDLGLTVEKSRQFPQRFNTEQFGAIYVSREPDTAAFETLRRMVRDARSLEKVHPRCIFALEVRLRSVIALTTAAAQRAWGLRKEDLKDDDMGRCREAATVAVGRGIEALRWPSATGQGESIALFWAHRQPGSHIDIVAQYDIEKSWLAPVASGTPVTTFLPRLKDYPLYPRPELE